MIASTTVLTERDGGVGVITLNRPEAMNALSRELTAALDWAVGELEADPAINVLVVTGAGERAFCAGGDIKEMAGRERRPAAPPPSGPRPNPMERLAFSAKPTIAAINGVALGGGALLASVVDIRIGCERAQFRFPGPAFGRINATWTLPLIVGWPKAKELLFSARPIDAAEALSIGLLNRLVDAGQLLAETLALARTIAGHPPPMIQATKALMHDYIGMRLPEMPRLEQATRESLVPPPAGEVFRDLLDKWDREGEG
jgi:enoyl-CoA hydratase/carnithine racemase